MIALIENEDGCEHKTDVIDVSVIKRCSGGGCYTQNKCVLYKPRTSLLFNVSMFCCCVRVRVLGMDVDAILALAGANLSYPSEDTAELRDSLTSLLPPTKEYNIKSIKGSNESFLAHFDIDVTTKDDLYLFLEQYKEVTKEQLRIAKNA